MKWAVIGYLLAAVSEARPKVNRCSSLRKRLVSREQTELWVALCVPACRVARGRTTRMCNSLEKWRHINHHLKRLHWLQTYQQLLLFVLTFDSNILIAIITITTFIQTFQFLKHFERNFIFKILHSLKKLDKYRKFAKITKILTTKQLCYEQLVITPLPQNKYHAKKTLLLMYKFSVFYK